MKNRKQVLIDKKFQLTKSFSVIGFFSVIVIVIILLIGIFLLSNNQKLNTETVYLEKSILDLKQIMELQQSVFISFHIKDWVIYMLLKVTDYKIHDLRLFGLKSLIINKKIDQLGRVDKYFNNKDIGC